MARTKNCPCAALTSSSSSPSPSPSPTLPPPPPIFRVTAPTIKTVPLALPPIVPPQIVVGPPRPKKIAYPGPFIKGQVGTIFFSLNRPCNYMEIPHGYSLIVQSFHIWCKHEHVDCKYIIVDPLGNKWQAPEVFTQWRNCVETKTIEDLDLSKTCLAIVCYGNTFKLCTSDKKK